MMMDGTVGALIHSMDHISFVRGLKDNQITVQVGFPLYFKEDWFDSHLTRRSMIPSDLLTQFCR
jgi:hypothetical protein